MKHTTLVNGPISPYFIGNAISNHSSKKNIGAHSIFLGQVRNDVINDKEVRAIQYTAHHEMAENIINEIREDAFSKYSLSCLHIYHSVDLVRSGEICLFVFTSSAHRTEATRACEEIVSRIKKEVPVWGKEVFEDNTYQWKVNT